MAMNPVIPPAEWQWFGRAGHLIVADSCRFHLHTHVGQWCVSTVGEWYMRPIDDEPHEIGFRRLYETMVFEVDADGEVRNRSEIAMRGYNERAAADAGHIEMCQAAAKGEL